MSGNPTGVPLTPGLVFRHSRAAVGIVGRSAPAAAVMLVLLAAIGGAAPVAFAWLLKAILDGLQSGPGPVLVWLAVALAGLGVVVGVLPHVARHCEAALDRAVRLFAFDRLFSAVNARLRGMARLEQPRFHDRLQLAQEGGSNAPGRVVTAAVGLSREALTLGGFLTTLVVLNPWLAVAVAAAAVPALRAELLLGRYRVAAMGPIVYATRRQFFYAGLLSHPQDAKEIRLFGLGSFFRRRMLDELAQVNDTERRLYRRELAVQVGLGVLGAAAAGVGLVWAVRGARAGHLTVGDVSVFVAAVAGVQAAVGAMIAKVRQWHEALLMLDHYQSVTTSEPDLPVPVRPRRVASLRDGITFHNVWFRYAPGRAWALRGIDLHIPAGRSVALVGYNGAGKSTVVKLLCRLYDPTCGRITWDGTDLREFDPAELRARIGAVFQDYAQYELSAAENIGLGDLRVLNDRDRIEAAARRAGIHDTLAALPAGYDTMLTRMFSDSRDREAPETGVLLSGGQGQRLALARAFLRGDRDLLILDEPSAGLDAEAEADIHRALRAHRAGRTSLLISHRLNTVRDADLIAVLAGGRLVEQGDHESLLEADGDYARLFRLQARGYADVATGGRP